MKRRKKNVWLIVYPFEYPALQAYLNDMAEKGWKLVSLRGTAPAGSHLKRMLHRRSITLWTIQRITP